VELSSFEFDEAVKEELPKLSMATQGFKKAGEIWTME